MSTWVRGGALVVVMLLPATGFGHGWGLRAGRLQVASYPAMEWNAWPACAPAPLGLPLTAPAPVTGAPLGGYARPTPAPPSSTGLPSTLPPPLAPSGPAPPPNP